jgi:hypothetical protein
VRTRPASATLLAALVSLAACAATTVVDRGTSNYAAKDAACEIAFFKGDRPGAPFESIGKVESHISRNVFLGGAASLEKAYREELRQKACSIGGDAVIIDDALETTATELAHVHVWATVIRYSGGK